MSKAEQSEAYLSMTMREEIRTELEATRVAFHKLLDSLSDEDWHKRSGNPAWTIGEVLFHMTLAPRLLPNDVRLIRGGRSAPKLPAFLFHRLNIIVTRVGARKLTRQVVGEKYDAAHEGVLEVLETVEAGEWSKGVEYPEWDPLLSGNVTMERLFRYLALHFEVHAEQIRQGMEGEISS